MTTLSLLPHLYRTSLADSTMAAWHHHRVRQLLTAKPTVDAFHYEATVGLIAVMFHLSSIKASEANALDFLPNFDVGAASSTYMGGRGRDVVRARYLHKEARWSLHETKDLIDAVAFSRGRLILAVEEGVPPVSVWEVRYF